MVSCNIILLMKNIKSGLVLVFLLFATSQSTFALSDVQSSILHPKGLLWKIEKQGMPASYLFGTMHVSDPEVTRLSKRVERALMLSEHFVMEVVLDERAIRYITRVSFFKNEKSLKTIMGEAEYKKLLSLLNKRSFIAEKTLNKMKPWAVLMLLMVPAEQQAALAQPLDMVLYQKALQGDLKVSGLESVEEQISVFDSMSLKDQLWMLNRTIDDIDAYDKQFPEMLSAYIRGDLAQLVNIQKASMYDDSDIDDKFIYQLLDVRNIRMATRMLPILKQGKAFVAIGALHLPGKIGVLHLLEKQGYNVSQIE